MPTPPSQPEEPREPSPIAAAGCRDADWSGIGTVVEVHETPGFWSGRARAIQDVTFTLGSPRWVRPGVTLSGQIRVGFVLVSGSALVEADRPALRGDRFRPDAEMLLCLRREGERWISIRTQAR